MGVIISRISNVFLQSLSRSRDGACDWTEGLRPPIALFHSCTENGQGTRGEKQTLSPGITNFLLLFRSRVPILKNSLNRLQVCWLHALVQERLRYAPLGWAHSYEFSDADLRYAVDEKNTVIERR